MLSKGDLVRIPANTCVIQSQSELSIIERYRYTKKPEIGIFIKYESGMDTVIFLRNEFCLIHSKDLHTLQIVQAKTC